MLMFRVLVFILSTQKHVKCTVESSGYTPARPFGVAGIKIPVQFPTALHALCHRTFEPFCWSRCNVGKPSSVSELFVCVRVCL